MTSLGLETESLGTTLQVMSPLGGKTSVGLVCKRCEIEVSGLRLSCDLRVIEMVDFDGLAYGPSCYHRLSSQDGDTLLKGWGRFKFKGDIHDFTSPCQHTVQMA